MTPDYYATLGVSPSSEDVVIRAAYLALMRRYHPDMNPSAEAAARASDITTAYEVLGNWDKRAEYDLMRAQMRDAEASANARWLPRVSPTGLFAGAAISLLLLLVIWSPFPVQEPPDRLRAAEIRQAAAPMDDPAAQCESAATRQLVKRELFRRAAQLRGSDEAAFERLAGSALVRIDSPRLRATNQPAGTIRCEAWVAVDLPPGVAVLGGRRNLTADIGYSLDTAAGGGGETIKLSNEGLIVAPLATLAQVRGPVEDLGSPPAAVERLAEVAARVNPPAVGVASPRESPPPRPPSAPRVAPERKAAAAKPSFDCRFAQGRGESSVCRDANLSRLDRHLAVLYGQSWGQADAAKRAQLLRTRGSFISRRDACRSESCVNSAYVDRMREVSDIMSGN